METNADMLAILAEVQAQFWIALGLFREVFLELISSGYPWNELLKTMAAETWRYLALYLPVLVIFFGASGRIGGGLGLENIFQEDNALARISSLSNFALLRSSPALYTQMMVGVLMGMLCTFIFGLSRVTDEPFPRHMATDYEILEYAAPRMLVGVLFSLLFAHGLRKVSAGRRNRFEWTRSALGAALGLLLGFAFVYGAHHLALHYATNINLAAGLFSAAVLLAILRFGGVIPAVQMCALMGFVIAFMGIMSALTPEYKTGLSFLLLAIVIASNGQPFKMTFPGLHRPDGLSYYDAPVTIGPAGEFPENAAPDLIDPIEQLENWREHAIMAQSRSRPIMVIVATSGGAYRASFWTAIVLDQLSADPELDHFDEAINLYVGASGGMVGAAYAAARRRHGDRLEPGIEKALSRDVLRARERDRPYGVRFPIPRDTLSPIVNRLTTRDLPGLLWPGRMSNDRGRVLEEQWLSLAPTFASVAEAERRGLRAPMVFSPMLVETGQPLFISNLDLSGFAGVRAGEGVELFRLFPGARDHFRIRTAVRMNATFPFVSPAVSLPSTPSRRVVDAGYYDNYGVSLASSFLTNPRVQTWLTSNLGGVILVQIRAFPTAGMEAEQAEAGRAARSFRWLSTPIEGVLAARSSTMNFRNATQLRGVQQMYPEGFIASVVFENDAAASLNWYLPENELEDIRAQWADESNQRACDTLRRLWASDALG